MFSINFHPTGFAFADCNSGHDFPSCFGGTNIRPLSDFYYTIIKMPPMPARGTLHYFNYTVQRTFYEVLNFCRANVCICCKFRYTWQKNTPELEKGMRIKINWLKKLSPGLKKRWRPDFSVSPDSHNYLQTISDHVTLPIGRADF